jgi:hypothetical protein
MQFIRRLFNDHQTGPMLGVGAAIGLTAVMIVHSAGSAPACSPPRCAVKGATVAPAGELLGPIDPEPGDLEGEVAPDAATAVDSPVTANAPAITARRPSTKTQTGTKASPGSTPTTTAPVSGDHGSGTNNQAPQVTTTTAPPGLLPITVTIPGG